MKSVYTHYKERLIEISGKSRSVYMRNLGKKIAYDIGKTLEKDLPAQVEFLKFLSSDKREYDLQLKNSDNPEKELSSLKAVAREADEVEKETGRYELFIGYPFVYGSVRDVILKAPLLFYPALLEVSDVGAKLTLKRNESVRLNKALIFAYAQARNINTEDLVTEFDTNALPKDLNAVLSYLRSFGIKIQPPQHKYIYNFNKFPEPKSHDTPTIMRACVIGRFSLANSIYNDYSELERKKLTSPALEELLRPGKVGKERPIIPDKNYYFIGDVDYSQRRVVEKVANSGNVVIYGPPGTGKSQTIVNIISDAICKGKKVLVVSQKKAALDVVYNRLGDLNEQAMFIVDPIKERRSIYEQCLARHNKVMESAESAHLLGRYDEITDLIKTETAKLEQIKETLDVRSPFGLNLLEMYYNSYPPNNMSDDMPIYKRLLADKKLMSVDYATLKESTEACLGGKMDTYYKYVSKKRRNPFVAHLKPKLPLSLLSSARSKLDNLRRRVDVFDEGSYPYARHILAHYDELDGKTQDKLLVKMLSASEYPHKYKFLRVSKIIFPLYPFAKASMLRAEKRVWKKFLATKRVVGEFIKDYVFLKEVLTDGGYSMAINALLEGNETKIENLQNALTEYVSISDLKSSISNFSQSELAVASFAYAHGKDKNDYQEIVRKILPLRIYNEIAKYEDTMKAELSLSVDFESIRSRISALLTEQKELARKICAEAFIGTYQNAYRNGKNGKDYLYEISKKQNYRPLRKVMELYGEYLFNLFPCWLLSPENVSTVLPLKKNVFDIVLFDEASQVFIESTIPSIFRGKNIVVAGDAKQLRPSATFMRRYMGAEEDESEDASRQAALEVESLLDLAVARFDSANITYHYRSASRELIDFSNKAFYDNRLHVSPNVTKSVKNKPIIRIKVDGRWSNRKNEVEAEQTVALIRKLLRAGKGDTIGVITFGNEQQNCIEDLLEKTARNDPDFRALYAEEVARKQDGQDVGLFVKNIENVQGDERDIIIFCVGYAIGENGKVNAHFGSLSADGGENRLNVAITRAKKKIFVITSIEPEELKVDNTKNNGPKLFKAYLSYVRAVASGKKKETEIILSSLCPAKDTQKLSALMPVEEQIAGELEKLGYRTETNLGEGADRISVAVYDKKSDKYVLGLQLDKEVMEASSNALERDVFGTQFLTRHGWEIMRVWSRDWWHDRKSVISSIIERLSG